MLRMRLGRLAETWSRSISLIGDTPEETLEKELLDKYYEFKGWNREGIPTLESLRELDLDYVAEDFLKRGILTEGEVSAPQPTAGDGGAP